MYPGVIRNSNFTFKAPPDMENCKDLRVRVERTEDDRRVISSAWHPTPAELAALNAGEPVVISIWGDGMPPISLWVDKP